MLNICFYYLFLFHEWKKNKFNKQEQQQQQQLPKNYHRYILYIVKVSVCHFSSPFQN